MVGQSPSIQSFFPLQSSPSKSLLPTSSPLTGDGFTFEELDATLHPLQQDSWTPSDDYDEYEIDSLMPGPKRIKIVGRIVNLLEGSPATKLSMNAKGSVHLVIKDDTGAVTVRLSYSRIQYQLRIGQLVTLWATYVANGDRGMFPCASAPLYIKVFPEKDKSCHLRVVDDLQSGSLYRTPPNYDCGLMSLKNFVHGGSEVTDAKVLVIVRSVSPRKKVTRKDGTMVDLVKVGLMDDTEEATLSLWGFTSTSASDWQPSRTALLISSPGLNTSHKNWLSMASDTFIDVDPSIPEAARLRAFSERMIRREHVNPAFPQEEYDLWSLNQPVDNVLYTLADCDDRARAAPKDKFVGYLSMLVVDMNITALRRQNMLMCNECCGIPLYANAVIAKCKQCDGQVPLGFNPRLIGKLIDETGCISSGKLVLSPQAWIQMLGRSAEELIKASAGDLKWVEQRMLYVRITLRFWWSEEVGKLAILEVLE